MAEKPMIQLNLTVEEADMLSRALAIMVTKKYGETPDETRARCSLADKLLATEYGVTRLGKLRVYLATPEPTHFPEYFF